MSSSGDKPRSIADFNAKNPKAATAAGAVAAAAAAPRKCTRRPDGTAKCQNRGCQRDFSVADNAPTACTYHRLGPVFHDTGKFWACCPSIVKYEFEDFMAVPGCTQGWHQDGSGDFDDDKAGNGSVGAATASA